MKLRLPLGPCDIEDTGTWPEVDVCDSDDCPRLATQRLHWVTGPVVYCDGCAAWMLRVAEALGTHVHSERLPDQPKAKLPIRGIVLGI